MVKVLVYERLEPTSHHTISTYRDEELTWPEFKQLRGAKNALECLPEELHCYIEMLSCQLEALRPTFRLSNPEETVDVMLFKLAEEPDQAALAFRAMISKGAVITVDSKESVKVSRGGCMVGFVQCMKEFAGF